MAKADGHRADAAGNDVPTLTGAQISAINRFPDDNPNPVMRIDADGRLLYANPASRPVVQALGGAVGAPLPTAIADRLSEAAGTRASVDVVAEDRTYALWPVPIPDLGFTNVYGQDVTAERAIVRFPDQNPNPVLRFGRDGRLTYANTASQGLLSALGCEMGAILPPAFRDAVVQRAATGDLTPIEVQGGGRVYAVVVVDVPGFGFINAYGTDITAVRERERLALENERLLLNILPPPIARRLRDGESLIADRFDDVTLMFADIVEFTRLSARMSPPELVNVLNEVFSTFDTLVDAHGLEKVKTIGDAYMVVGGMVGRTDDHAARVAGMALELADRVGDIDAAVRHRITFRIGIHSGPVVAGVIGTRKFIYDVWGDTVNLASRMESLGIPGRVQVTPTIEARLRDRFVFEERGPIDVKGVGLLPTYLLVGHAPG